MTPSLRPTWIALEGLDGSGKSTQAERLTRWLADQGVGCRSMRLYGSELLARQFEGLNRGARIRAREASLMTAAELAGRMEVLASLAPPPVVLWDKYVIGSRVRDRARGADEEELAALYEVFPAAQVTLFFAIEPAEALARKRAGGGPRLWESGLDVALGLEVQEIERRLARGELDRGVIEEHFLRFQERVKRGYQVALPADTVVLDAAAPVEEVAAQARRAIAERLGLRGAAGAME